MRLARYFGVLEVGFVGDGKNGAGAETPVTAEELASFVVNEPRHRIREIPFVRWRVSPVRTADRVHVQHPAAAQQLYGVVEPAGNLGKVTFRGTGRVLSAHFPARQKRTVLVQHNAGSDKRGIGQEVRQAPGFGAVFDELQHVKPPTSRQRLALAG